MKEIPLTQGYVALVDDEDYSRINKHKWFAHVRRRGSASQIVYAVRNESRLVNDRKSIYMHRQIVNAKHGLEVDHIDGNTLNNTKGNLREATSAENSYNQRKRNTHGDKPLSSEFRGITVRKYKGGDVYWVRIQKGGAVVFSKQFKTIDEAIIEHTINSRIAYGEFSRFTGTPEMLARILEHMPQEAHHG